jgi:nucleotide-binding universal stress UspA family protein
MFTLNCILYPTDLSESSHAAWPLAAALAGQTGARIEVLHVLPPLLYQEQTEEHNHPDLFYAGAREALERFAAPVPGVDIERTVTTGKASTTIVDIADEAHADLIFMVTHGKTGLAHLLLGSTSEEVLRAAGCPVLCIKAPGKLPVSPSQRNPLAIRLIVCPIDFSESCKHAMTMAFALARTTGARIVLLHVVSLPDAAYMGYGIPGAALEMNKYQEDMREALDKANCPDSKIPLERRLEEGNPPDVIVEVAGQVGADLIVMGTHGYKGLTHAVMGSVAEQVMRKATCPVLTLRARMETK